MKWIEKLVDVPKLVRRVWLILWITLAIFVVAKLCFNMWYPIVIDNEFIINICLKIDNNEIIKYIIMLLLYVTNANFFFLTCVKEKKYNKTIHLVVMNLMFVICQTLKYFYNTYGNIFEIVLVVVIPIFVNLYKHKFYKKIHNIILPIIIYMLFNIWQLNIFFIRGIGEVLTNAPVLIVYALQIDYYIFTIITWIGVSYFMGAYGIGWLWGKSEVELLALKEKELAKEKPDLELVKEIDEALKKAKDEVKA